jgi:Fe-S-cluster-containing hydrogenase component 2
MEEHAIVNEDLCLGCGLCVSVCPEDAMTVELREERDEPYDRVVKLGEAIYKGKKKLMKNNSEVRK